MPLSRKQRKPKRLSAFGRTSPHLPYGEQTIESTFDRAKYARRRRGPRVLYHYTDWEAAENIIRSQRFRATAHSCTNDPAELASADSTIRQAFADARDRATGMSARLLDLFLKSYEDRRIGASQRCYLVCFSQTRNDPHQWCEYGRKGMGVCLGLRLFEIPEPRLEAFATQFMPVQYNESAWRSKIDEWLDRFIYGFSSAADVEHNWQLALDTMSVATTAWALAAKRPQWEPEREVRMIFLVRESVSVQSIEEPRVDGTLRRYVTVPLTSLRRMPVVEVIVGPKNERSAGIERGIQMLRLAAYPEPESKVVFSDSTLECDSRRSDAESS